MAEIFVLDTSVTMAWCFRDEFTPRTQELLIQMAKSTALVPVNWNLQVANALIFGERRSRVTMAETEQFLRMLDTLRITVAPESSEFKPTLLCQVARRHGLTAYDAAFLEVARLRHLPIATTDGQMEIAARSLGIEVL